MGIGKRQEIVLAPARRYSPAHNHLSKHDKLCAFCRAHVIGALLGAQHGEKALPGDWQRKAAKYRDVKQMVHVIIVQRKSFVPFHINRDPSQQPEAD